MICPSCKNNMIVLELNQVEIDYCTQCEGIWLDTGELELLLNDEVAAGNMLATFKPSHENEKKIRCPICRKKMQKVSAGEAFPVVIDKCKRDHGLWFDRGELQKVLKDGNGEENQVVKLLNEMFSYKLK